MRSVLIIRHGLSEANNHENFGTPAFGNPDADLMPDGRLQAERLGRLLAADYGINQLLEPVAVSSMRRTRETAIAAGFRRLRIFPELNEEKGGLSDAEIALCLVERRPPQATTEAARLALENPPSERIWFSHGLLIATICQELGVYQDARFTPKFCEIRELII